METGESRTPRPQDPCARTSTGLSGLKFRYLLLDQKMEPTTIRFYLSYLYRSLDNSIPNIVASTESLGNNLRNVAELSG